MKKNIVRSFICFLLAIIMITECNLGAFVSYASEITEEYIEEETEEISEEEFIPTANSYLYPFEEAVTSLEELAVSRDIQGVIYLADEVVLKALPEDESEPMKVLYSGDVVSIVGIGQDAEYNIWYKVTYKSEIEEVTGYVLRDYVACVDEEFLLWQDNYVRSISIWGLKGNRYSAADVEAFPESYQDDLIQIKEKHPNWIFVKMNTNIYWDTLVKSQLGDRSLIENSVKESWKNGRYGSSGWSYASEGILKYFLDPRNFLNVKDVFMFELLGYYSEYHTVDAVESILKGTFMANATIDNGKTYAQTFVDLGRITGVSPFMIASRVRQEQGAVGDSALISGKYEGYEGYYNYFNIGAAGETKEIIIKTGLDYAKEKGWNTQYKALKGGAEFLVKGYINAGQDTLYLQKFDVDNRSNGVFWHQYMQNIRSPYFEAKSVYNTYDKRGLLDQPFIFRIPVYNNMSSRAAVAPGDEDIITLSSSNIDNLQVDSEITLRPYINGKDVEGIPWEFISSDASVATVDNYGVVKALKAGEVTITCQNAEDKEYTKAAICKIKVVPANIDVNTLEIPELETITYNPNGKLKDVKLPEGYSWANPDMVPLVAQATYSVIYNPNQEKYNPITFNINLTVNKRTIASSEYTIPTGLEGGATRELSSVMLPNGFMWVDPTEKLADTIGTKEYLATYNMDIANYETVTDIKIPVKIVCEKHSFTEWEITEATCEEDGIKTRKCTICDSKEELVINKSGHLYEAEITTDATEEAEGVRTYSCKNCDNTYTESIPKLPSTHVHEYEEEVTKKASCTETGLKTFTCSCEDSYTEVIEAVGHKMDNGRCQNCGYTEAVETPKQEETDKDDANKDDVNKDDDKDDKDDEANQEDGKKDDVTPSAPDQGDDKKDETNKDPAVGDDTKEESDKTPLESDKKPEEGVKQPTTNEEQQEEGNKIPPESTDKPDEGVKQPTTNEEQQEEGNKIPPESTDKPDEGVKQPTIKGDNTVEEHKAELELMSNLVEMVDESNEDGEKKTVSIELNKNTEISQKIVEMAKEHGVDLEVSLPNALKWTIKADSLGDEMPSSINLNAQIVSEVIEKEVIYTVVTEEEYVELSLSHDGVFGFEATLTVPVEEKYIGQTANLFYFNEKTKELEFIMAAPVDEDGNVLLDFNHASDYIIVFAEKSMEGAVKVAETITENVNVDDNITEEKQEKNDSINKLIVICIIILVVSGGIALAGLLLFKRGNELDSVEETPTFEEWLKEDTKEIRKEMGKAEDAGKDYFDDDKDDYREKEVVEAKTFHTGEIYLEEDYLDDDVDDYQEKN